MKIHKLITFTVATTLAAASVNASDAPVAKRKGDGSTTITFPNGQSFHLPVGKGLLGPSSNPTSQLPFTNEDGSVVAVNEQPMTKTSFIHIYTRRQDGRFSEVQKVNERIRKAVSPRVQSVNPEFIRVERVSGRTLDVTSVSFASDSRDNVRFRIGVDANGSITTAR